MNSSAQSKRSIAWIYYSLIAIGLAILSFSHPAGFVVTAGVALYATYLFRGGRIVIWLW